MTTRARVLDALVRGFRILLLTLYWVLTRLTLYAVLGFLSLFFLLNSGPFPALLSETLRSVLPGTLHFERLQVSPIPWKVDLFGVRIHTPEGRDVVTAQSLQVTLDLAPTIRFLAGRSQNLLEIAFRSVRLRDFWCEIAFDEQGELEFLRAFVWPPQPQAAPSPPGAGPDVRLNFRHIIGERGRFHLSFPEWELWLEDITLDTSLMVREDGHVWIRSPVVTFSEGGGRVHAAPGVAEIPREVRLLGGRVEGFDFDTDHFSIANARIAFQGMAVEASGSLAFPSDGPLAYTAQVTLSFPVDSPLVAQATHGLVRGAMTVSVKGSGDEHDPRFHLEMTSSALEFATIPLGALTLAVDGGRPGFGREPYAFHNLSVSADSPWGRWRITNAAFHPFGTDPGLPRVEARATLDVDDLDLPALLAFLNLSTPPASYPFPSRVSGSVRATGFLHTDSTIYEADVSLRMASTLLHRSGLDGPDARVSVASRITWAPHSPDPGPRIEVRDLSLRSGKDHLRARGSLDLHTGTVRAWGMAHKDLAPLFVAFGSRGEGRATLTDIEARGTWRAPVVSAEVQLMDLSVAGWTLREARARARLAGATIAVSDLSAEAQYAHASVRSLQVALLRRAPVLTLDDVLITRINWAWVPLVRPLGFRGTGEVTLDHLEVDLSAPERSLRLAGSVVLPQFIAWDRRFQSVRASFRVEDGRLDVPSLTAQVPDGGTIQSSLTLDLPRLDIKARLEGHDIPLGFLTDRADAPSGLVSLRASVSGPVLDPALRADATIADLSYKNIFIGSITLTAVRESGQDLSLSSDHFLPKMRLDPSSGLTFRDGRFTTLRIRLDMEDLTPQDIAPTLSPHLVSARFSGHLDFSFGLAGHHEFRGSVVSPPGGLMVGFLDREVMAVNEERLEVTIHESGEVTLSGLALSHGHGFLRVCGELMDQDGQMRLLMRGPVPLALLRYLQDVFSIVRGAVILGGLPGSPLGPLPRGCSPEMTDGEGSMVIAGSVMAPRPTGSIRTEAASIGIRRLPDIVEVEPGGRIVVMPDPQGHLRVAIAPEAAIRGRLGGGRFRVDGEAAFREWLPNTGVVRLSGSGLRWSSPGAYYVVLSPEVTIRFADMASPNPESRRLHFSGRVDIEEGSFHRNYDVVRKAFSGVAATRVAERQAPPLAISAPWLAQASLDLSVTSSRFGVRSRLPFGSTDLDVVLDLAVRGTVENPEVWNRVEVLPGGRVTYNVVRREFEVTRGTVDFDGDPRRPILEVTARTSVDQSHASASTIGGSRFEPETQSGSFDPGVVVTLAVAGRFPDLDVSLTSNSRDLDQTDLQYLLLTGSTQRDAVEGRSGMIDLGLVTEDMTNLVTNLFLSPFVDAIRFGVSPSGGVNAEVQAHVGSRLRFETQVLQEAGGSRYRAGFQVRLTDRLYLEGRMRAVEQSTDPSEVGRRYEAKLRYRIPIE